MQSFFLVVISGLLLFAPAFPQGLSPYTIDTFAGSDPVRDGVAATDSFLFFPSDVAVDAAGNVYIADESNRLLRKVDTEGVITTVAGNPFGDNSGPLAVELSFRPDCVAVSPANRVFFCSFRRVYELLPDGTVLVVAGTGAGGGTGDGGPATSATFTILEDIAFGPDGSIYVVDRSNDIVRKIDTAGTISPFAGTGVAGFSGDDGPATAAQIDNPNKIDVDAAGNVYVGDAGNSRIRRIATNGVITTFAGDGGTRASGDGGPATAAGLGFLRGVAVSPAGDIFVFDFGGVRRIDSEGIITRLGGSGGSRLGDGGPLERASFRGIAAITFAATGEMYLVDQLNHRVRAVSVDDVVETIAGSDHLSGDGGPATDAALLTPRAVTLDAVGNLYIADTENAAVRRVAVDGVIETVAGGAAFAALGDGGPAIGARLRGLLDVAIHPNGELYIADTSAARVRRVDASGVITTAVGGTSFQSTGDGGPATEAGLRFPQRITFDSAGNLFIADGSANVVRKVDGAGIINTVVGNGTHGFSGDGGPATEAEINRPRGIVALASGDLYVAEGARIRHVNPGGVINTLAELPFFIDSISRMRSGDLLAVSIQSSTLHRVGLDGTSEPFGGFPFGFSGDDGPADEAQAKILSGALEAPDGRIFLVDSDNHRIRVLDPGTSIPLIVLPSNGLRQAASFAIGNVSAESIASLFGTNLALELKVAEATPLPTQLGGAQVFVRDSAGTERVSELFFVSPTQINFLVPAGSANGSATLIARRADGQ